MKKKCRLSLKSPKPLIIFFIALVFLQTGYAYAQADTATGKQININFSTGDLQLEVSGLDESLITLTDSTKRLTIALEKLSENPNLSDKETRLIREAITEISNTASKVADIANQLPESIKRSQQPIEDIGDALVADVKSIIALTVIGLGVVLFVGAFLAYIYLLKPVMTVAENMKGISTSIENAVANIPAAEASEAKKPTLRFGRWQKRQLR